MIMNSQENEQPNCREKMITKTNMELECPKNHPRLVNNDNRGSKKDRSDEQKGLQSISSTSVLQIPLKESDM